ncbi:hypothetical protein ACFQ4H_31640, partial [Micromonospora sonneratiae]
PGTTARPTRARPAEPPEAGPTEAEPTEALPTFALPTEARPLDPGVDPGGPEAARPPPPERPAGAPSSVDCQWEAEAAGPRPWYGSSAAGPWSPLEPGIRALPRGELGSPYEFIRHTLPVAVARASDTTGLP